MPESSAREELLALSRPDRAAAIAGKLVSELRERGLEVSTGSVFGELDKHWDNLEARREALDSWARSELGLSYLHTAELDGLDTVEQLAAHLAVELEPPPAPEGPLPKIDAVGLGQFKHGPYEGEHRVRGRMVFALGTARSGTTLFRTLLGAHPQVFAPPELNVLPFNDLRGWRESIDTSGRMWMAHGLRQALSWQMNLSADEAHVLIDKFAAGGLSMPRLYELLLGGAGAGGWLVDKSPLYAVHRQCLERAEQMFVEPRYIYLTRHPHSVIESLVRMRFHRLGRGRPDRPDVNPWLRAESNWLRQNTNIVEFLRSVPEQRQIRIRFEDLVADPPKIFSKLEAFLELDSPWPPANEAYVSDRVVRGLGDPNQPSRKRVDPALGERWKNVRLPQKLDDRTVELAVGLGYRIPEREES